MADLLCPDNVDIESYLRGSGEKQNSRGASREVFNNTNPSRNSNIFPEHSATSGPTPDLTWKKVQATSTHNTIQNQPNRESLSSELSEEQIDWLDQMVQLYGSAFERDQWIESFKSQNAEASANYMASLGQSQSHPATTQENLTKIKANNLGSSVTAPSKSSDEVSYDTNVAVQMYAPGAATGWYAQQPPTAEAAHAQAKNGQGYPGSNTSLAASGNWADYSKQYAQYSEYWNQQHGHQPAQPQSGKPQFPQPPQPPPSGSDAESWKAYCQLMERYWSHWSSQADQTSTRGQAQGQNTTNVISYQLVQPPLPTSKPPPLPKGPAPS